MRKLQIVLGFIGGAGFFLMLGAVGAMERENISFWSGAGLAAIGLVAFIAGLIGAQIIENEIDWREKNDK